MADDNKEEKWFEGIIMSSVEEVGKSILHDTIIPQAKKMICDVVNGTVRKFLYGSGASSTTKTVTDTVSYWGGTNSTASSTVFSHSNLALSSKEFEKKESASELLEELQNIIDHYKVARVADFKELGGGNPSSTDQDYGWKDISRAKIIQTTYGWRIEMPKASPINLLMR